jgi:ElaB/YqjD/DUF883 family membrane-anchored ribosome-binding protein
MDTKKINTRIDDAATKAKELVAKTGEKLAGVARSAGTAATNAGERVERTIEKSEHVLEETAEKAGHKVKETATKLTHAAQETTRKLVHGATKVADKDGQGR